jgi:hypothetical protein
MSEQVTDVSVEPIAVAVTQAVADVESCGLLELPPLYNTIDVGALEAFCAHEPPVVDDAEGVVSFRYSESLVSIERGESVTLDAIPASHETGSESFTGAPEPGNARSHVDD